MIYNLEIVRTQFSKSFSSHQPRLFP